LAGRAKVGGKGGGVASIERRRESAVLRSRALAQKQQSMKKNKERNNTGSSYSRTHERRQKARAEDAKKNRCQSNQNPTTKRHGNGGSKTGLPRKRKHAKGPPDL